MLHGGRTFGMVRRDSGSAAGLSRRQRRTLACGRACSSPTCGLFGGNSDGSRDVGNHRLRVALAGLWRLYGAGGDGLGRRCPADVHPFGSLATLRLIQGPWLCVTASRRFCLFEDEEVPIRCWGRRGIYWVFSVPREHPRTAHERNVVQKKGQSNAFHDFSKETKDYGKRVA